MARINSNVPALVARFNLGRSNADLETRLERLATGLRINRGADDPAGLITSERIGSELRGVEQAIRNGQRASNVIATTEASLAEVNTLLLDLKRLFVEAANTGANSREERDANQLQIDSAIQSITRISNTASFGGLRLLDGSLDYTTSGIDPSTISQARIRGASFIGSSNLQVEVDVLNSAQQGGLYIDPRNSPFRTSGAVVVLESSLTLQIGGNRGIRELSFASGQTLANIRDAVNNITPFTGVTVASTNPGNINSGIVFLSEGYGSESFVSVERVNATSTSATLNVYQANNNPPPATFPVNYAGLIGGQWTSAERDTGRDVSALVNGALARGNGLEVKLDTPQLSLDIILDQTFATDPSLALTSFDITGGGSLFQLGPEITAQQQVNIGVQSVAASKLGAVITAGGLQFLSSLESGGPNDIATSVQTGDFSIASDIIEAAIDEVTVLRGRLGSFEANVLQTNERSLQAAFENLSASRSVITDADFAEETSKLTRAQILQSSSTSVLTLANQQSQSVLQLLG
ncbi:MAG: flagellin [Planctomycetota bacterium]